MSPQFVRRHHIGTRRKKEPFPLMAIDGKPVLYNAGMVTQETDELPLRMGHHREKLQFDITEAPGCDVVLGLPWLKESNAMVNWRRETISFDNEDSRPMPLSVVRDALDGMDIHAMSATELREAIEENPDQVQVLYCKKTEGKPDLDIPPEYTDFKHLFEKEADEDALLPH
jgi:hypothetical protein